MRLNHHGKPNAPLKVLNSLDLLFICFIETFQSSTLLLFNNILQEVYLLLTWIFVLFEHLQLVRTSVRNLFGLENKFFLCALLWFWGVRRLTKVYEGLCLFFHFLNSQVLFNHEGLLLLLILVFQDKLICFNQYFRVHFC